MLIFNQKCFKVLHPMIEDNNLENELKEKKKEIEKFSMLRLH